LNGYEFLNMTLKRVHDLVGYVLIVARGDGKVLVLGTDNARNRLIAINACSPLEHDVFVYRTDHFREITQTLQARYKPYSVDGFGLWFELDLSTLRDAIAEFDLGTGQRVRMGPHLRVGGRATVKDMGAGTITAINERGAVVALDRPKGSVRQVIAPRALLEASPATGCMTTASRIVISEHSVLAALSDWKAEREAAEREAGPDRAAADNARSFQRTPGDYAADLAPYVFSLLKKHAEAL
jgi:hypothetical protein